MAASRLPSPGSEFGPCLDECQHRDCAETRKMAAEVCHYCGETIGYERGFFKTDEGLVHSACLHEAVDQER